MSSLIGYNPATISDAFTDVNYRHIALSISGTTHTLYLDGSAVAVNSNAGNIFSIYNSAIESVYIGCAGDLSYGYTGIIDDFKIWNRALPASDILTIYSKNAQYTIPFTDLTTISGLQLWLDSAATNTIQLSGTNISVWKDKSTNNSNGTSNSNIILSLYNLKPAVYFNSGENTLTISNLTLNVFPITFFSVFNFSGSTSTGVSNFLIASTDSNRKLQIYQAFLNGVYRIETGAGGRQESAEMMSNSFTQTMHILTIQMGPGNHHILRIDGSINILTDKFTECPTGIPITNAIIKSYLGMYIQEEIYYQSKLTYDEYTKVEGYLAKKWGLQSSLPSNHPYQQNIPKVLGTPNYITSNYLYDSNFLLWIDASSPNNFKFSSSNIIVNIKNLGNNTKQMPIGGDLNNVTYLSSSSFSTTPYIQLGSLNNTHSWINTNINNINYQYELTLFYVIAIPPSFSNSVQLYGPIGFSVFSNVLKITSGGNIKYIYVSPMGASNNGNITDLKLEINNFTSDTFHIISFKTSLLGSGQTLGFNGNYTTYGLGAPLGGNPNVNFTISNAASDDTNSRSILYIQEVLGFNRSLSTLEFKSIEGYLAWKWGIQTKLASSHPFKNSVPSNTIPFYTINDASIYLPLITDVLNKGSDIGQVTVVGSNPTFEVINGFLAANFTGSTVLTILINNQNYKQFTAGFWIYKSLANDYTPFSILSPNNGNFFNCDIPNSNTINFNSNGMGISLSNTYNYVAKWTHIVFIFCRTPPYKCQLYINGVFFSLATGNQGGTIEKIVIGQSAEGYRNYSGGLRDFFVFNTILTSSEIKNIYESSPLSSSS